MASIEYEQPESIDQAMDLLATFGDDAKVLAGGLSLIPAMSLGLARPSVLIDIGRLGDLDGIDVRGDTIVIRSLVRHRTFVRPARDLWRAAPLVAAAAPFIGSVAIRNRGTFGGSIVHGDPASEIAAAATALSGRALVKSRRGERWIGLDDLYLGYMTTSIAPDELLIHVELPAAPDRTGASVQELAIRTGDYAIAAVGVQVTLDMNARITNANIAVFGVSDRPIRSREAERAICADGVAGVEAAAVAIRSHVDADDPFASRAYRQRIAGVLLRRAVVEAVARAQRDGQGRAS